MRSICIVIGLPICIAVGFLHFGAMDVNAENSSESNGREFDWYNAGVGVSSFGDAKGMSFSYTTDKGLISLRYIHNFSGLSSRPLLQESIWDAGVLYGMVARTSFGLASVSGGVSAVGGVRVQEPERGSYDIGGSVLPYSLGDEVERFYTVGIPLAGQLLWTPNPYIGLGIYGYANLNPEVSFAGALLGVQLGSLW